MDCFQYLGSQVAADGGCERDVVHRMNEGYKLLGSAEKCNEQLRWFGHVERIVLMAEVSGARVRGRPRLGWMDGVKVALCNRGMTMEAARKIGKSGEP